MAKTLELVFRNAAGQEVTLSLADPKESLTLSEAQTVMADIIAQNIFTSKGGDLTDHVDARLRSRETVSLT